MATNEFINELVEELDKPISPLGSFKLDYVDVAELANVIYDAHDGGEFDFDINPLDLNVLGATAAAIRYNSWELEDGNILEGKYLTWEEIYDYSRDIVKRGVAQPFVEMIGKSYGTSNLERSLELAKKFEVNIKDPTTAEVFDVYKIVVQNTVGAPGDLEKAQEIAHTLRWKGLSYLKNLSGCKEHITDQSFLRCYNLDQLDKFAQQYKAKENTNN